MWYTNIYSNKILYKRYLLAFIKVRFVMRSLYVSGPKADGVPTNNRRERGTGPCQL